MPYRIERYKDGWRVYSISGTPLSHKPLSLEMAKKQKVAATLSTLRSRDAFRARGGSASSGIGYPLTDTDIQLILGGTSLFKYPELDEMSSIDDAFDEKGRCVMLYLTQSEEEGHWVCMIKKGDTIEYFDPYGGYKPDGERKWLTKAKAEELGQDDATLSRMLKASKYKVVSNPYHFQKEGGDVNTCGRHCCVRLYHYDMSLPEYKKTIEDSGMSPDEYVTSLTAQVLHK
jgi:hypothetical protein